MGLSGCYSILKYLLVIFNLLFWVLGLAGIIFGIWMLVDPTFMVSVSQQPTDYKISVIIIIVASILLVIVSAFGIYGALKESQCALTAFFSLLLIIFVAEISAGLWAYINSDSLELQIRNEVKMAVKQEYWQNENLRALYNSFHKNLHCCGVETPTDWMGNIQLALSPSSEPKTYNIPKSCCRKDTTDSQCEKATQNVKALDTLNYNVIYDTGCYTLLITKLKEFGCLVMAIGIAVAVIQILGLIFALILAFVVNRSNRYKA